MLKNKRILSWAVLPGLLLLICAALHGIDEKNPRLNFLLITVDDMNWDSLGVNDCKVAGISPNIDHLASQGLLFNHAHVTIAVRPAVSIPIAVTGVADVSIALILRYG